jgi:hypothetical protein
VHLTAMNLALKNIESKTDAINVLERDSLGGTLGDYFDKKTIKTLSAGSKEVDAFRHLTYFDAIVGNPPYFNLRKEVIDRKYKGQKYESIITGVTNIASLFLKRYIDFLKPGGYLGFVVPKSITYSGSWEGIRNFILEETEIVKIFDIHEAFEGVLLEQIAIIVQKKPARKRALVEVHYIDLPYNKKRICKHKVDSNLFTDKFFPIYRFKENSEIYELINKDSEKLENLAHPIFRGPTIQKYSYLFTDKRGQEDKAVIRGANITNFGLKDEVQFFSWKRPEFDSYKKQFERLLVPKIMGQRLIAQTRNHMKLIATLDENGKFLEVDTVNNVVPKDDKYDLKYLLGILNSKLASYYIYNFVFNRAVRTMDFKYVSELPIKEVWKRDQNRVVSVVDKILKEGYTKELEDALNSIVYDIYGLKGKHVKIIEESFE